jgi:hypothetical protein
MASVLPEETPTDVADAVVSSLVAEAAKRSPVGDVKEVEMRAGTLPEPVGDGALLLPSSPSSLPCHSAGSAGSASTLDAPLEPLEKGDEISPPDGAVGLSAITNGDESPAVSSGTYRDNTHHGRAAWGRLRSKYQAARWMQTGS